jgi:hypothetical protein
VQGFPTTGAFTGGRRVGDSTGVAEPPGPRCAIERLALAVADGTSRVRTSRALLTRVRIMGDS